MIALEPLLARDHARELLVKIIKGTGRFWVHHLVDGQELGRELCQLNYLHNGMRDIWLIDYFGLPFIILVLAV